MTLKTYISTFVALVLFAVAAFAFTAYANPGYWGGKQQTATASTTLAYLSPGAATTTLTYDTFEFDSTKNVNKSRTDAKDATLLFQYTASGTEPRLNVRLEYSNDNIDWYPLAVPTTAVATDTPVTRFSEYQFALSTTTAATDGNLGSGTAGRVHQALKIDDIPTRYIRAIFYVPAAGGNGGLYAEFIPRKEQ